MSKNAKIGYLATQKSGCSWYRTIQPMNMLKKFGIETNSIHLNEDIEDFDNYKSFQFYGALPFSAEKVLNFLKKENKKIVYDSDDALDLIDKNNFTYYSVMKDKGSADEMMRNTDVITVTTSKMKEYIQSKIDKPIVVVPNCFTKEEWLLERPKRDGIRVGFAGSSTHIEDLIEVLPAIKKLQDKYDITFIIMGFGQGSYVKWFKDFRFASDKVAVDKLYELDRLLSEIKFEWVDFVDYDKYPSSLINMSLDIGLCPLKDTPFNQCRSACKAMEYTLAGALALASDVGAYRDEMSSVLVKPNEWESAIEYYILYPERRENEIALHLEWIKENRNIDLQLETYKRVYGII